MVLAQGCKPIHWNPNTDLLPLRKFRFMIASSHGSQGNYASGNLNIFPINPYLFVSFEDAYVKKIILFKWGLKFESTGLPSWLLNLAVTWPVFFFWENYGTNNCWFPLARKWPTWKWTWIWIPYGKIEKKCPRYFRRDSRENPRDLNMFRTGRSAALSRRRKSMPPIGVLMKTESMKLVMQQRKFT